MTRQEAIDEAVRNCMQLYGFMTLMRCGYTIGQFASMHRENICKDFRKIMAVRTGYGHVEYAIPDDMRFRPFGVEE